MRTTPVSFDNKAGYRLTGLLDTPDEGDIRAFALLAHCFTCGKDLKPFVFMNRALTAHGIAVLRFDFSGLGDSAGEFSDTNLSSNQEDLLAAAAYLESQHQAPQILIGHSMGGAAVIRAARYLISARAVVTIAAPADPDHLGQKLSRARDEALQHGSSQVAIGGQHFTLKKQFFENLAESEMKRDIFELNKALLILHSPADATVEIDNAAQIFQWARHPKSFVSLNNANHLMLDRADARYAGEVIAAWVTPHLVGD